jgi:hypothetical protein
MSYTGSGYTALTSENLSALADSLESPRREVSGYEYPASNIHGLNYDRYADYEDYRPQQPMIESAPQHTPNPWKLPQPQYENPRGRGRSSHVPDRNYNDYNNVHSRGRY